MAAFTNLIPHPQRAQAQNGSCDLRAIAALNVAPQFARTADNLRAIVETGLGKPLPEGAGNAIDVVFDPKQPAEGYALTIAPNGVKIAASDAAGALYGVQSLRVMARWDTAAPLRSLECAQIDDYPRFGWRGLLLDEGRHFFGAETVKRLLRIMALNKLNVLHWHLTDDQGWRVEIKHYPLLTEIGSQRSQSQIHGWKKKPSDSDHTPHGGFYTQEQLKEIVAYADALGIMIVPEIDMPAHFAAAFAAYSDLACRDKKVEVPWYFGGQYPVSQGIRDWNRSACIGNPKTMEFIHTVIDEISEIFPAPYFHIGGDEAPKEEWKTCPKCQALMQREGLANVDQLQAYFTNQVQKYVAQKGKRLIGWNEVLKGNMLDDSVIVQYWTPQPDPRVKKHLQNGGEIIISKHQYFYFDMPFGQYPLDNTYRFQPYFGGITPEYDKQIKGVEAAAWTEWIADADKLDFQLFPRLIALSEVAWYQGKKDKKEFYARLDAYKPILEHLGITYAKDEICKIKNPIKRLANQAKWYNGDENVEYDRN